MKMKGNKKCAFILLLPSIGASNKAVDIHYLHQSVVGVDERKISILKK